MRRVLTACVALLLVGFSVSGPQSSAKPRATSEDAAAVEQTPPESPELEVAEPPADPVDPYEGWESWCEDLDKQPCRCDAEVETCKGDLVRHKGTTVYKACEPDVTGRPTVCLRKRGECIPRWLNRKKQKVQRANLRIIIDHVCKPPAWWTPDVQCWKFKWRTARKCNQKRWCDPEKLHRFFRPIILRESTWDWETRHFLDPDRLANQRAWAKHKKRKTYEGNKHFLQRDRWGGLGWLGQNSPHFVYLWDSMAPPEVLCRRVPAVETARRLLRKAWRKIAGGIDCVDAEGVPYTRTRMLAGQKRDYKVDTKQTPTWYLLHRAVWGGDLCPQHTKKADFYKRAFEKRLAGVDLDPHEEVTLEMLGRQIPVAEQNAIAAALRAQMQPLEW